MGMEMRVEILGLLLVLGWAGAAGASEPDAWVLARTLARLEHRAERLFERRDYTHAEIVYRRILRMTEAAHGPDHLKTAEVLRKLGQIHQLQGRDEVAEEIQARVLAIRRAARLPAPSKEFPGDGSPFRDPVDEHWSVASARNEYGDTLHRERWNHYSEPHLRKAWRGIQEGLGPIDRADTRDPVAIEAHRVGVKLYRQGRYREAIPHLQRAARTWALEHGPDDPRTIECRWRLAKIHQRLGRRIYGVLDRNLSSYHPPGS